MKKKIKENIRERFNRLISLLIVLVYITALLPAQEISYTIKESRQRLDYYLEKADVEYEEASWEKKAEAGLEEALAYWESKNTYLKESDYEEYEKQKNETHLYLEMEKNRSYAEWLCNRAARASSAKASNELTQKLRESRSNYETSGYTLAEASELRKAWNSQAEIIINNYLDKIDVENKNQYVEIKERLIQKGLTDYEINNIYEQIVVNSREAIKTENRMLSESEGSKLIVRFLEDKDSIKAEKSSEAAKFIARDIANNALTESNEAMDTVFTKIEKSLSTENLNDVEVTELLSNFKTVFNNGLEVWENAESEFLKNRQEWEKEASLTYQESEARWHEAYEELREKREIWEKNVSEKIKKIQKEIEEKNKDYESRIVEMYNSYSMALNSDKARLLQVAESQINLYNNLRSALVMSKQGIESWYGVWSSLYNGLYSYWKTEDNIGLNGEIKYSFDVDSFTKEKADNLKKDLAAIVNSWMPETNNFNFFLRITNPDSYTLNTIVTINKDSFDDTSKPLNSDLSNLDQLISMVEKDAGTSALVKNLKAIQTAVTWINDILYYKAQIEKVVEDIYKTTGNRDNISYKSELEVEISEAEKLVQYWEEELYVAEKVEEYARTTDANRDSSEKTKEDKKQAEELYNEAFEKYNEEIGKLEVLNNAIGLKAESLSNVDEELSKKRSEIEKLTSEYQALLALDQGVDLKTVAQQIKKDINEYQEKLNKNQKTEENLVFNEYAKSVLKEYDNLNTRQTKYITEKQSLLENLTAIRDVIVVNSKNYYLNIKAILETLGSSYLNMNSEITDSILRTAEDLDEIISNSSNSEEYKKYCNEQYVRIIKNELEYLIESEKIRINAAEGKEKQNIEKVISNESYVHDVVEILNIKAEENEELIKKIEEVLEDSSKLKEKIEEDNELKAVFEGQYIFKDNELKTSYDLLITGREKKKEVNQKLIDNLDNIDEEGKLFNAEYKKGIYEENRKALSTAINSSKKAETEYAEVLDYVMGLYDKTIDSTETSASALTDYISAYLSSESFRYRRGNSYNEESVKATINQIKNNLDSKDVQKLTEEEYKSYLRDYWTYVFLTDAVNHSKEYEGWLPKLKSTTYLSSDVIGEDKKEDFVNTINNWEDNLQKELEAAAGYEKKYFSATLDDIQAEKDKNVAIEEYSQNAERIAQLKMELLEFAEIYSQSTLNKQALKVKAQNTKELISQKEKEYQEIQDGYNAAVKNLTAAGENYNKQVEKVNDEYRKVLSARKELRAAQAVYDWAESIYLENLGATEGAEYVTPKEKVSSVLYAYERAKLSLEVLKELQASKAKEKDTALISDYKAKDKLYYDAYILNYEISEKAEEVFAKLRQAEQNIESCKLNITGSINQNVQIKGVGVDITTDESGKVVSVSYKLDNNSTIDSNNDYFTKKTQEIKTLTLNTISKTLYETEAEKWLKSMMTNQAYFEEVIAASLYYELYLNGEEGKKGYRNNYEEDVFKILETGNTSDFPIQGYSKKHGNDVGGAFKSYIYNYLKNSYNSVTNKEDIAKCILFRKTSGSYGTSIESIETFLLKKKGYNDLQNWFQGIADDHWFSSWFFWGVFRSLDAEGKWADEGVDVMKNAKNGANANYNSYYTRLSSSVSNLNKAIEAEATARKDYNKVTRGSEDNDGSAVKGSEIKKTIKDLLKDNKNIKDSINIDLILSKIKDTDEFTDVVAAMNYVLAEYKKEAETAKGLMEAERKKLTDEQAVNSGIYEIAVESGLEISADNEKKLRELALKASDLTLTVTERTEASAQYDELFRSLNDNTDGVQTLLKNLANNAWGMNTYDSTKYSDTTAALYENYINGSNTLFTNENRTSEIYMQQMFNSWLMNYSGILESKNNAKLEEYANELDYSAQSYETQNYDVINQLYDIRDAAKIEWNKAEEKLNSSYNTWKRDFLKAYQRNTEEWQDCYEEFLKDKQEWITTMYMEAANQTAYTEEKTAEAAMESLNRAKHMAFETMQSVNFDTDEYVEELLGSTNLSNLESHMAEVSTRLDKIQGISIVNTSNAADTIADYLTSQRITSEITARMEETASKLAAAQAVENLNENINRSYEMVDQYNQYYEDYVKELVLGAGYTWTKSGSTRKVAVDTSLMGTTYDNQHVNSFQWFKTALPEVSIGTALLGNLEGEALLLAMAQDENDLEEWRADIFGSEDEDKKGKFNEWVGEGGKLKENLDPSKSLKHNTESEGSGQMGAIILDFSWNEVQKNKGIEELGKASWDQKIWSGDFLGFEPPSIRTVATVAAAAAAAIVGAVATPFTGGASAGLAAAACSAMVGAAIGAAITFTNECLFAVLDLAGEYKTPEEIGKQLATSAASSAIGILGAGAGSAVSGLSGIGGVLAKTGVSAATSVTTTVATNAIQYAGDWDAFADSMKNFDTWKGCISSTAGSLVTNSLNSITLGAGNIKVDGFNSTQIGSISSLNSTIGSLASTGVTFGLTGEATFNILNISDFGAGASSGLLELSISKDRGISSRLGTGGADISSGTLKTALAGLNNLNMNSKIKNAAKANGMENAATALRMQYGFGDEKQLKQLDDILNGEAVLKTGNGKGDAQTIDVNGRREVYLNNYKDNMTREEMLAMGITLGHEAYRDGVVGTEIEQINETVSAVLGHTAMADRVRNDRNYETIMKGIIDGNQNLKNDLAMYDEAVKNKDFSNFGEYVLDNYDYSADYWKIKMKADGTHEFLYDGKETLSIDYLDADGKVISTSEPDGQDMKGIEMAQSLVKVLGAERAAEILMQQGIDVSKNSTFSMEVITRATGISEESWNHMPSSEKEKVYSLYKESLVGELLMNTMGASWDGKANKWQNTDGIKLTITDKAYDGNIMAEVNADGRYLYSTVNAYVFRDPESWKSATSGDGENWVQNESKNGLDYIVYTKTGLNHDFYDALVVGNYQTVDYLCDNKFDSEGNLTDKRNQPFQRGENDWIQGNTVATDFNLEYYSNSNYKNEVFVTNNATTVDGTFIRSDGRDKDGEPRWLGHDDSYKDDNNNWKNWRLKYSDGCFITTEKNQKEIMDKMESWNVPRRTQIKGHLNEFSYSYYMQHKSYNRNKNLLGEF